MSTIDKDAYLPNHAFKSTVIRNRKNYALNVTWHLLSSSNISIGKASHGIHYDEHSIFETEYDVGARLQTSKSRGTAFGKL